MNRETFENIVFTGLGLLLSVFLYIAVNLPQNTSGSIHGLTFNMTAYAASVLSAYGITYLVYRICASFFFKRNAGGSAQPKTEDFSWKSAVMPAAVFLAGAVFIYGIYDNESSLMGRAVPLALRNIDFLHVPYFLVLSILGVCAVYASLKSENILGWTRRVLALLAAGLCTVFAFAPSPDFDTFAGILHIDAYVTSIINIAKLIPFSEYNISIYGHYAIMYLPLVKLFGGGYTAVAISISLFCFISFGSFFYVCSKWIKSDAVFAVSLLSMTGLVTILYTTGQYFQVNPHRLLFPALTLGLITYIIKNSVSMRNAIICCFAAGSLAVVWNLETGLFCLAVMVSAYIVQQLFASGRIIDLLSGILKSCLFIAVCISSAYLFVNAYDFCMGCRQWMSVKEFIYPIGAETYTITNYERIKLPSPFNLYALQIIIFSLSLASVMFHTDRQVKDTELAGRDIMKACCAVSGMCALVYFMNRPAYSNIAISWPQMVLVLALFGDSGVSEFKNTEGRILSWRNSGRLLMLFCLIVLGIESSLYIEKSLEVRNNTTWNTGRREEVLNEIRAAVPANTFAFGTGTPEIYCSLGWDPGLSVIHWPDMNDFHFQKVREELAKHDAFFARINDYVCGGGYYELISSRHKLVKSFEIGPCRYGYYKNPNPRPALAARGGMIRFGSEGRNADSYIIRGFSYGEKEHTWTDGEVAEMAVHLDAGGSTSGKIVCSIDLMQVFGPEQELYVKVNGRHVFKDKHLKSGLLKFSFDRSHNGDYYIAFKMPKAKSPKEEGGSEDARKLALGFRTMKFSY